MRLLIIGFLFFYSWSSFGQRAGVVSLEDRAKLEEFQDTLALAGYAVVNDSITEYRFGACKKLIVTLKRALQIKNSFNFPFDRAASVSIQYPQDSSFRIFTWQLYVDKDTYRYYGAIQMNSPDLKLIPLIDRSTNIESSNLEQMELTPDQWYGNLIYSIRQFDTPQGRQYLLFGFDGYRFFFKRKLIDVLHFKDGKAVFGSPVFVAIDENNNKTTKKRVLKEYSADASVSLKFVLEMDMIITEHLERINGNYGEGPTFVPDGSYEGYKLENGAWTYIEKVFSQISEEPPIPYPHKKGGKVDIVGRKMKQK